MKIAYPHFIVSGEPLDLELEKVPEDNRLKLLEDFLYNGKPIDFFNGEEEVKLEATDFSEEDLEIIKELYKMLKENSKTASIKTASINAWITDKGKVLRIMDEDVTHEDFIDDLIGDDTKPYRPNSLEEAFENWIRISADGDSNNPYLSFPRKLTPSQLEWVEDFLIKHKAIDKPIAFEMLDGTIQANNFYDLKEQLEGKTASKKAKLTMQDLMDNYGNMLFDGIADREVVRKEIYKNCFIYVTYNTKSKHYWASILTTPNGSPKGMKHTPTMEETLNLAKEWVDKFANKTASYIDFPHEDLAEDVWNKKDGTYIMKSGFKDQILKHIYQYLSKFDGEDKWLLQILFGSSLTTQFYNQETDIDIKLVMDFEKFLKLNPDVQELVTKSGKSLSKILVKDLRKHFKGIKINNRDLDVYAYQFSDVVLIKYDSLYNVLNDKWIKEPHILDLNDYNKLINYIRNEVLELAESYANKIDLDLGKLRRRVIELNSILKLFKDKWKPDELKILKEQIKKEINDIELSINNLDMDEESVSALRNRLFEKLESEFSIKTDLSDVFDNLNWLPENLIFKFLQKWGYVGLIKQLEDLLDDDNKISLDDVKEIQKILGIA